MLPNGHQSECVTQNLMRLTSEEWNISTKTYGWSISHMLPNGHQSECLTQSFSWTLIVECDHLQRLVGLPAGMPSRQSCELEAVRLARMLCLVFRTLPFSGDWPRWKKGQMKCKHNSHYNWMKTHCANYQVLRIEGRGRWNWPVV